MLAAVQSLPLEMIFELEAVAHQRQRQVKELSDLEIKRAKAEKDRARG